MPHECLHEEDLRELIKTTNENKRELRVIKGKDWYDNKELYEMIEKLKSQFQEFNESFHKYNGLVEKYNEVLINQNDIRENINSIKKNESIEKAKRIKAEETNDNWKSWIGWVVGILSFLWGAAQYL